MEKYQETKEFWEKIFGVSKEYEIDTKLKHQKLDEAVDWVATDNESIIDFGCGRGVMLYRTLLNSNVKKIVGIDLSNSAINMANKVAINNEVSDKAIFICGGIEQLKQIKSDSFDGCILSNVLDNLTPDDSITVLEEFKRIIRKDGKLLVKYNPYIEEKEQEEYKFEKLDDDFYKEQTGLYIWNLNNDQLESLLSKYFKIVRYEEIYYKEYDMANRLFYLVNE